MNNPRKLFALLGTRILESCPFLISLFFNLSPFIALVFSWELYVLIYYCVLFYLTSKYIRILVFFFVSLKKITRESQIDWISKINKLQSIEPIHNFIIFAFANESYEVLEKSVNHLLSQQYDPKKIIVVLAHEAKYPSGVEISNKLIAKFTSQFADVFDTEHILRTSEIASKSANVSYSLKCVEEYATAKNYYQKNIVITICDSDSLLDKSYIAHLNYNFLTDQNRHKTIWSGAMVCMTNYNNVAWYIKTINILFSIVNISLTYRWMEKFVPNSTFSLSLKMLREINFISTDVIHDDFHTFLKALYKHQDHVFCKSLNCITMASIPNSGTKWRSVVTQYQQVKRWGSGINEISYMVKNLYLTIMGKLNLKAKLYVAVRTIDKILDLQILGISGPLLAFNFLIITQLDPDFELEPILTRHKVMIAILTYIPFILGAITWYASYVLRKNKIVKQFIKTDKRQNPVIVVLKELIWWGFYPFITIPLTAMPVLHAQYELFMNKKKQFVITDKKG